MARREVLLNKGKTAKDILALIGFRPLECAADYTTSRAVLLKVAKLYSERNAKLWPYVNCHAHCLRQLRKYDEPLEGSELLAVYEEIASKYVNDSNNR